MPASRKRDRSLERDAIAAQGRYVAALQHTERIVCDIRQAVAGVDILDLVAARRAQERDRVVLSDLLADLGYIPSGFTARLGPDPDIDA